jgi:hypothetical protein
VTENTYAAGSAVITLANAPDPDTYRPDWLPKDIEMPTRAMLELGYCMEYNPAPFTWAEIATAEMTEIKGYEVSEDEYPEGYGDRDYEWDVRLKDGRRFNVTGWHDYTGWGCQDGAEYIESVGGAI